MIRLFLKCSVILLISLYTVKCVPTDQGCGLSYSFTNQSTFPTNVNYRYDDGKTILFVDFLDSGMEYPVAFDLNLDSNGNIESFIDSKPGFVNIIFNSQPQRCVRFPIVVKPLNVNKIFLNLEKKMVALFRFFRKERSIYSADCAVENYIIDNTLLNQATEEVCTE